MKKKTFKDKLKARSAEQKKQNKLDRERHAKKKERARQFKERELAFVLEMPDIKPSPRVKLNHKSKTIRRDLEAELEARALEVKK